jgi:hypothetical protein
MPEPDASFAGCLTVRSGREGSAPYHSLWTYDPVARLISEIPSDEHGTFDDVLDANLRPSLYWKLDEAGRVIVRAGDGGGYKPFRQDTSRDEHENPVAFRATYSSGWDLNDNEGDAGVVYASAEYSNKYDGAGRLLQQDGSESSYGTSFSTIYEHDAQGRCEVLTRSNGGVERRDYDSAGRLWHRVLQGMSRGGYLGPVNSTLTYHHDDLGRLSSAAEVLEGQTAPVAQLLLEYRDDGGMVEQQTFDSDTGDGYYRRVWSRGCSALLPMLLRERSLACEADDSAAGDFRIP